MDFPSHSHYQDGRSFLHFLLLISLITFIIVGLCVWVTPIA